jgi:hypothetical protein
VITKDLSRPNQALALYYGTSRKPLAHVIPDPKYPGLMWRVAMPDGRVSEMVNLTRAKDIAMSIVERGPPRRDFKLLRWQYDHLESLSAARWCAQRPEPTPTTSSSNSTAATTVMHWVQP